MRNEQDGLAEVIAFPGNKAASGDRQDRLAQLRARMLETENDFVPNAPKDARDGAPEIGPESSETSVTPETRDKRDTRITRDTRPASPGPRFVPTSSLRADSSPSASRHSNVARMPGVSEHDEIDADAANDLLVRALARSPKSVSEADRFLAERTELGAREREAIINRMLDLGYLDDARLAEQLVSGSLSRKGLGHGGMTRELRKRGIDDGIIREALGSMDGDEEFERALELARERAGRFRGLDYETAERRLYGYLARRGFGGEIVRRAVNAALT
ncbi:regulatory protein RecX [Gulosibacter molinativorax]|uniref:Regulatory protein RecX n=1 Tax=Gulosibacter molinativorax TaxID=256821 RepID=A0ABT7C8W5_9MICO|nr:regulatory protein RecX [Gulosibacter molinativorax]MDJ1371605.1 RecX family transcriptional regulator [Gulosibacter molinativorax]QUY61052.1 Regulatory protein RecX [Gulosibacter molinativorax]